MRPDEHKKKKNAAYKKKHGITKNTSDKKEEKRQSEKGKPTFSLKNDSEFKICQLSAASAHANRKEASASSSSSDSETSTPNKKKSFKRREIVSNWQKYELQPEEEKEVSALGENYEKLLSMAGGEAISHFRFKDELAWDDSTDPNHGNGQDTYSQFLSVNTAELVESLECLPLHKVLGISQNIFPAEQLSSMMNKAKERNSDYISKILGESEEVSSPKDICVARPEELKCNRPSPHSSPEGNKQDSFQSKLQFQSKDTHSTKTSHDQKKVNSTILRGISDVSVKKEITLNNRISDSNAEHITKEPIHGDESGIPMNTSLEKLKLHDEDLDVLLYMDDPTAKITSDYKEASSQKQMGTQISAVENNNPSTAISSMSVDSKLATEKDSLEAWLDSVLDD